MLREPMKTTLEIVRDRIENITSDIESRRGAIAEYEECIAVCRQRIAEMSEAIETLKADEAILVAAGREVAPA